MSRRRSEKTVAVGLTVGRLTITKDLGVGGGRRLIRVKCSECGESQEIRASNFSRTARSRCRENRDAEREAERQAEREQQAVEVERRKRERLAARRVPLETQREIERLGALREPLAPGFTIRTWRVNDLARKFGVPRTTVERILNGEDERREGSP